MDFKIKNKVLEKKLKLIMIENNLKFYEELIEFLIKKSGIKIPEYSHMTKVAA